LYLSTRIDELRPIVEFAILEDNGRYTSTKARVTLEFLESSGLDLDDVDENMKAMIQLMRMVAASNKEEVPKPKMDLATISAGYDDIDFLEVPEVEKIWALKVHRIGRPLVPRMLVGPDFGGGATLSFFLLGVFACELVLEIL